MLWVGYVRGAIVAAGLVPTLAGTGVAPVTLAAGPATGHLTARLAAGPALDDARAAATARAFLAAFQRDDKATMLRLMSARLLARNYSERVAQMLGVQNTPLRIDVVGSRDYRHASPPYTYVIAVLRFQAASVTDALTVIPTSAGYRVDSIVHLSGVAPVDTRGAVAVAREFLSAFQRRDKATMLRLMSARLLARNYSVTVARMLGVQNTPLRVDVVGTRLVGATTYVTVRLVYRASNVTDSLGLITTRAGYRVDTIAIVSYR